MAGQQQQSPDLPPIRACIFDMDGLLIDSEDIYSEVTNRILSEYGRPRLPWSVKAQLQGRPGPAAGEIFRAWAQLPISAEEFATKQSALQRELFPGARPLPGVERLLATLEGAGVQLALATSSHAANYALKTAHLAPLFARFFPARRRVLGDDPRVAPGRGKPAGDIYLVALAAINDGAEGPAPAIAPAECLVFEDSVPGVEAGRRAGMRVCWCPHPGLRGEYEGREPLVLAGLTGQMVEAGGDGGRTDGTAPEALEAKVREVAVSVGAEIGLRGWPGRVGDGWAAEVESLEAFDYERFGIAVPKA